MKYYHSGDADEIQAVLRGDGFIDVAVRINGVLKQGVYLTDSPGEWDPELPDDQLLEITLPQQIDLSEYKFDLSEKPCNWQEWFVPCDLLDKRARVRLLTTDEWKECGPKKGLTSLCAHSIT